MNRLLIFSILAVLLSSCYSGRIKYINVNKEDRKVVEVADEREPQIGIELPTKKLSEVENYTSSLDIVLEHNEIEETPKNVIQANLIPADTGDSLSTEEISQIALQSEHVARTAKALSAVSLVFVGTSILFGFTLLLAIVFWILSLVQLQHARRYPYTTSVGQTIEEDTKKNLRLSATLMVCFILLIAIFVIIFIL